MLIALPCTNTMDDSSSCFSGTWDDWSLPLYAFISSFIHGSWTLTWNCDWDIWFPSYYVLGCDWHAWGIIISECVFYSLVILHHMAFGDFVDFATHWLYWMLWGVEQNFLLSIVFWDAGTYFGWTRYFGEEARGLGRFCEPEEHCIEHQRESASFLIV